MKSIPHILSKVYCEPWLILPEKHRSMQQQLEAHMLNGGDGMMEPDEVDPMEQLPPYVRMQNGTALIQVQGIIGKRLDWLEMLSGGYDLDSLCSALGQSGEDSSVARIAIDWNTPGGISTGVIEAGQMIERTNRIKPVVSYVEMDCCSAGTWLATQSRAFYAAESSRTGSIGVYAAYLDRSAQMEEMGVKMNALSAGKYKLAGAPFKPMEKDERIMLQSKVDRVYTQFRTAVARHRPDMPSDSMEGQCFDGQEAADIGLTDGVYPCLEEFIDSLPSLV